MWYQFCRKLFSIFYHVYNRLEIHGRENVPPAGAFLLAMNHVSFMDPPLGGVAVKRKICYLARKTLFKPAFMDRLLRSWGCVPFDRDGKGIEGLKTVLNLLKQGEAVLMYPEGTRGTGELQEGRAGIGLLVAKSQAPVIPMRVWGTERALPRDSKIPKPRKVVVAIGKPIQFPPPPAERAAMKSYYEQVTGQVMDAIAKIQKP